MAAAPTSQEKPPFDKLIDRVPTTLLKRELGQQREGERAARMLLNPCFKNLPSVLSRALYCGIEKLGACFGLEPQRVSDVISAASGDREKQIHYLLLTWLELHGVKITVEVLLRRLYDADDTKTIEEVAEWMNDQDFQRGIPSTKTLNFVGGGKGIPDSPSVQPVQGQVQMAFCDSEGVQSVVPEGARKLDEETRGVSERQNSQSEQVSEELPPEVSLPPPFEESSDVKKTTALVLQSSKEGHAQSEDPLKPVQESQQVPRVGLGPVMPSVPAFESPPAALVAVQDVTIEEHEMVSTNTWKEKMERDMRDLKEQVKEMDEKMENMRLDHRRESSQHSSKLTEMTEVNQTLKSQVMSLEKKCLALSQTVKETNEKLQTVLANLEQCRKEKEDVQRENLQLAHELEALKKKSVQLNQECEVLKEQNQQLREDGEATKIKAGVIEKEKGDLLESNEKLRQRCAELEGKYAQLENKYKLLEMELQEKNKRINLFQTMAQKQEVLEKDGSAGREADDTGSMKKLLGSRGFGEVFAERDDSADVKSIAL